MSVIAKSAFDSSKFKHKIKSGGPPSSSHQSSRGPIKASYELPNRQWQVKYQYNSPSKTVKNNGKSGKKTGKGTAKVAEESSEYGTMENPDNPGAVPLLNIEDNSSCFNDVTIEERRERIGSILDEILSIPRLAEANITKRSLSRSSMARFTGGGSVRSGSSQMNNGSRASNFSRYSSQDRKSVLVRSVSSPKITTTSSKPAKNIDNKKKEINSNLNRRSMMMSRSASNVGKSTQKKKTSSEVPKLNLALDLTSRSQLPGFGGQRPSRLEDNELSAEFLPTHNISNLRPTLGNVTQAELAISPPTLGDDTIINIHDESDTFEMEKTTDFVRANMKISPKKINSGRTSAASTVITAKHRTGSVPKYLKARQAEWAEAAADALASIPDPDCPPGHVRLEDEVRTSLVTQLTSRHAALLQEWNRLPVSSDSRRVVNRRHEIETELGTTEDDIKRFSRPKVFLLPEQIEKIIS